LKLNKNQLKLILIYIASTLLPTFLLSCVFVQSEVNKTELKYQAKAQRQANFHAMSIDHFIGETIGRLEMLATSIKIHHNNLQDLERILIDTHKIDQRFSGFYWAHPNGDLLIGTNPMPSKINVFDRPYFQQTIKTQVTNISEAHIGRVTGRLVITIATPVFVKGQLEGVLMASISIEEIEKQVQKIVHDGLIIVTDDKNQRLITAGITPLANETLKAKMHNSKVPWTTTYTLVLKKGNIIRYAILTFIGFLTLSNILFLFIQNLRLRRKVRNEKIESERQKLELIGNLAASTAHEIRNPLTGIKGLVKLMSEENTNPKNSYYFGVIQTELDRINLILSELLLLGKPADHTLRSYNVNDIMAEIEPIIQSEATYMNIQVQVQYSTVESIVSCVRDQLKQVILNLTKNALQAMPDGGSLTIMIYEKTDYCHIQFVDTGVGIPEEMIAEVFHPFFSMKKDGTGLGLTVCKRIIESFNGTITIESKLQKGTVVEIRLPLVER
jgi:two-component system, sporulation sensor kinase D